MHGKPDPAPDSDSDSDQDSEPTKQPYVRRRKYDPKYKSKAAAHYAAVARSQIVPNLPAEYLGVPHGVLKCPPCGQSSSAPPLVAAGTDSRLDFVVEIDVGAFKEAWSKKLKNHLSVKESRDRGVALPPAKKHALRRALANFVVQKKIVGMKSGAGV